MQHNSTYVIQFITKVAATGLVVASAGFGGLYAERVGAQHSILLAGLSIVFAIALECVKPLAIAQAFQAFASWSPLRGTALTVLGIVAVAYSLTSELALMASSRGDLAAGRASLAFQGQAQRERYARAKDELGTLKASRPLAELEALEARLGCAPCPFAPELGRARRKVELDAILRESVATSGGPVVASADPGSAALVTYLSALGITANVDVVAQWLALVPVLALELGSALSALLVSSVSPSVSQPKIAVLEPVKPQPIERERVAEQIVRHLRAMGGEASASHRGLARRLGVDRNMIARSLNSLVAAGLITLASSKAGTCLRLLA